MRNKEQLDQIEKEKGLNFYEDDDEFIRGLQDGDHSAKHESAQSYLEKEKRKSDKKNLKFLDATAHQYEPITKNLYIESREISNLSEKDIVEFRRNKGDIKVRGVMCPKPINSWYQCGLP